MKRRIPRLSWPALAGLMLSSCLAGCDQVPRAVADIMPAAKVALPSVRQTGANLRTTYILAVARGAMERQQFKAALDQLEPLTKQPVYQEVSPQARYEIDRLLSFAAFELGEQQTARAAVLRSTASPLADADDWMLRLETAKLAHDWQDASEQFHRLKTVPDYLDSQPSESFSALDEGLGLLSDDGKARYEFERALEENGWRSRDPYFSPDNIHYHYAAALVDRGDHGKAMAIVSSFTGPQVVEVAAADARFRELFDQPERIAFEAAQRQLEVRRKIVAENPTWLYAQAALSASLYHLGRETEAQATAEALYLTADNLSREQRAEQYDGASAFKLAKIVWSWSTFRLGKYEEALAMQKAAWPDASDASPDLLLASGFLVALGRGEEAVATLAPFGDGETLRPEAIGLLYSLRACAAHQARDAAVTREALSFLSAHPFYNPSDGVRALLCVDDVDAAAALLVSTLRNPQHRHRAIELLQIHRPRANPTAVESAADRKLDQLRRRPDVAQAIASVGRINTYRTVSEGSFMY